MHFIIKGSFKLRCTTCWCVQNLKCHERTTTVPWKYILTSWTIHVTMYVGYVSNSFPARGGVGWGGVMEFHPCSFSIRGIITKIIKTKSKHRELTVLFYSVFMNLPELIRMNWSYPNSFSIPHVNRKGNVVHKIFWRRSWQLNEVPYNDISFTSVVCLGDNIPNICLTEFLCYSDALRASETYSVKHFSWLQERGMEIFHHHFTAWSFFPLSRQ